VVALITADGQVLLTVKPQVSTGRINATTTLPESETTEVETRVMLSDGEAVVIGGLINEKDVESENKLPFLGNIKYIGWLFRRKVFERERSEVIIVLQPRIVCEVPGHRQADPRPVQQAMTPIFAGSLVPIDRTIWEPPMPTAGNPYRAPRPPIVSFEPVDGPMMGLPGETRSPQIYPPMPPLPSAEPIPAPPPSGEYGQPQHADNAVLTAPFNQRPQGVPAQYMPSPYAPSPYVPAPQPLQRPGPSIIPLPPLD